MIHSATEQPDWAVVQEIHAIHRQGGNLKQADITIVKDGITIRREYRMPDGSSRIMKNDYPNTNDLTYISDMLMLGVNQ